MSFSIQAPAKINLTLEVLEKRDDGYHEIRSILQTISLADILTFAPCDGTEFHAEQPGWDASQSLVSKAVDLFRQETGVSSGVSVAVEKHIPLMSGLGGDSSDAAAVLVGLNRLWETGLPVETLHAMAEKLGSDVPFFLYGGTALVEGRGEKVTPLPDVETMDLVIVMPSLDVPPGKTGRLFAELRLDDRTDGSLTRSFAEAIAWGQELPELSNIFENVAGTVFPELEEIRSVFEWIAGGRIHLAGAGPVLFTVVDSDQAAMELCTRLLYRGFDSVIAASLGREG